MAKSKVDSMEGLMEEVRESWCARVGHQRGSSDLFGLPKVEILMNISHPNIIKVYDFFSDENNYYLTSEIMAGGELFERIVERHHYSENDAREICFVLLNTLAYLHDADIVHRDLKPENLLMVGPESQAAVKIADFGFAKRLEGGKVTDKCGTPGYVAPEVIKQDPYGVSADVWSLGVIIYILLCGYPPFHHSKMNKLFQLICRGQYRFYEEDWNPISDEAKDLIRRMLTVDVSKRITSRQALKHPWLQLESDTLAKHRMDNTLRLLHKFNLKRKFRAAVHTAIMTGRLQRLIANLDDDES
eukprot:scaffold47_cov258-Pinguiococcus_pyrenoidosus.AAC.53